MTPKEQYEARRAAKRAEREQQLQDDSDAPILDLLESIDRIASALERIADALEAQAPMRGGLIND